MNVKYGMICSFGSSAIYRYMLEVDNMLNIINSSRADMSADHKMETL